MGKRKLDDSAWRERITEQNIKRGLTFRTTEPKGEVCLFCNNPEKNYNPPKGVEFVCSNCVIVLSSSEQAKVIFADKKAERLISLRQMRALKMFIEEEEHVKETRNTKRRVVRGRSGRPPQSTRN